MKPNKPQAGLIKVAKLLKHKILSENKFSITVECLTCGNSRSISLSVFKDKKGKFCSRKCFQSYVPTINDLNYYCKSSFKLSISELQNYITNKKITMSDFAKEFEITIHAVKRTFKLFDIKQYYKPGNQTLTRKCKNCNKEFIFVVYENRLKDNKHQFCSVHCKYIYRSNTHTLDLSKLKFDVKNYQYYQIKKTGDYSKLKLGKREAAVKRNIKYNDYFFTKGICNEETAYVLGLWYTDGHVAKKTNSCAIQMTDEQIILDVAKELKYKLKISKSSPKNINHNPAYKIIMASPFLKNDFIALGCVPGKTFIANYPNIKKKYDRHFIRGAIDGDGSFSSGKIKRGANLRIVGTDKFMYGIHLRIKEHLNISAQSITIGKPKDPTHMQNFASLTYGLKYTKIIADWLYKDAKIFLKRKGERAFYKYETMQNSLTTTYVGKILKVSRHAITRFIKDPKNKIAYSKIGTYNIINKEKISDFLGKFKKHSKFTSGFSFNIKKHIQSTGVEDFNIN
tara:strand:- start:67 stop:1596 length:1530 start_codon:yes stop_codon:yes gene_type:complete